MWRRNICKRKRNLGLKYTSVIGKQVSANRVKQHSCTKCRFKCSQIFSEDERLSMFRFYYGLVNYEQQPLHL